MRSPQYCVLGFPVYDSRVMMIRVADDLCLRTLVPLSVCAQAARRFLWGWQRFSERQAKRLHSLVARRTEPNLTEASFCLASFARQCAQTARANGEASIFSINHHAFALDVRPEHPLGRVLRVTHTVPKHWALSADFALCHNSPLFFDDQVMIPQRPEQATGGAR